jgi:hypothetical protein
VSIPKTAETWRLEDQIEYPCLIVCLLNFSHLRPNPPRYRRARKILERLQIQSQKALKVKYLFVVGMDIVNPATPNLQHSSLIVISGLHRTAECYDSLNINRTQRMQEKLTRAFAWLSHERGRKFVPGNGGCGSGAALSAGQQY